MDILQPVILFGVPDPARSRSLRTRLQRQGFRVSATASARNLLESVDRDFPDVVVLDDLLDEVGGSILTSIIRGRSPKTRIIRLLPPDASSLSEVSPEDDALLSLQKPVSLDLLWETITGAVRRPVGLPLRASAPLILCVDDDRLYLRSLSRILRRHGYRVRIYTTAERALEELPLLSPDLMLVDVLMPGMNGLELIGELRDYRERPMPIVLLSARDSDEEIQAGYQQGATCYLTKPCVPGVLLDVVERLVKNPPDNQGPRSWGFPKTRRPESSAGNLRKARLSKRPGEEPSQREDDGVLGSGRWSRKE